LAFSAFLLRPAKVAAKFIVSFTLNTPMAEFYDRCPLVKGPSFGTTFSILCPYLYLAHYDLVSSGTGKQRLEEAGLEPDLLRLSIGLEDPDWIIGALQVGFGEAVGFKDSGPVEVESE
jgi:cystathionine gamma-synthase